MANRRTFIGAFVHRKWANIQKRAGKYRHLGTASRQINYAHVKICFTRQEFADWCWDHEDLIRSLSRPSIDRIDNQRDYCFTNIQIIELKENIAKEKRKGSLEEGPCYACGEIKNKKYFYSEKRRWCGYSTICKDCDKVRKNKNYLGSTGKC